jgi:hypothetical protein
VKDGIQIRHVKRLPTGRGIAGVLEGIHLINIYAPSGAEKKSERETLFNKDIPPLLPNTRTEILLAADFNCVMTQADTTGHTTHSKTLDILIKGLSLQDTWNMTTSRHGFTHYTPKGAARLDSIYVSSHLMNQKQGIETTAAAFTAHMAVILCIATDDPIMIHGRGHWRMNTTLLRDKVVQQNLNIQWKKWKTHQKFYPNNVTWWERYVKPMLKRNFQREGTERRRERRTLENFYYAAIYDTLEAPMDPACKAITLKHLKAQITNLHYQERQTIANNMEESEVMEGEDISLYQYIRTRKRQTQRTISQVQDADGIIHITTRNIIRAFTTHLREKYSMIQADTKNINELTKHIRNKIHREANDAMEAPILMGELETAVKMGKSHKAPGCDWINTDYFKIMWDATKSDLLCILNEMFIDGKITDAQKKGLLVCVPKIPNPRGLLDCRPLTLLNADYKLLTRIIANRMQPWLGTTLRPSQYCGMRGRTMLEALATVRDAIANAQYSKAPLCVVTLDFTAAFDNISHEYVFTILKTYGFSEQVQQRIRNLYTNITSVVKLNGHISQPIPIQCAIRQGCPLSMQLYAICLDPLLNALEAILTGSRIGRRHVKNPLIAYADDVTLLVSDPQDIPKIQAVIQKCETASWARINYKKSKAMAIGTWKTETNVMDIPYYSDVKILGIHFTPTVQQTVHKNWALTTSRIRGLAQDAYYRELFP